MKKKKRLLFLIESQIKSTLLMYLLPESEIDFDFYLSDLSGLIFELAGIDTTNQTDELYNDYFTLIGKGQRFDIRNNQEALKQLSLQIYNYLVKYSELCAILKYRG